jgi:plastocyanin
MTETNIVLNRAVFSQHSFDSAALTVLTTLFHHFPEAGHLFLQRGDQVLQRTYVHVVTENAPQQLDIDLARLGEPKKDCESDAYTVIAGGVIAFHVSQGVGQYNVTISQSAAGETHTLLNNREGVPEGDLFAVTLVQPGTYRVTGMEGQGTCEITVELPQGRKYRVDQVTLVEIGKDGTFSPSTLQILAGQTVIFLCRVLTRIRVEQQPDVTPTAMAEPGKRQRYTLRNPRMKTIKK